MYTRTYRKENWYFNRISIFNPLVVYVETSTIKIRQRTNDVHTIILPRTHIIRVRTFGRFFTSIRFSSQIPQQQQRDFRLLTEKTQLQQLHPS